MTERLLFRSPGSGFECRLVFENRGVSVEDEICDRETSGEMSREGCNELVGLIPVSAIPHHKSSPLRRAALITVLEECPS
jgi:hypothetical protein